MEAKEKDQPKVKRLRFSDRDDVKEISRLSGSSSVSNKSSKRYSITERLEQRTKSAQSGILTKAIDRASTKEPFSEEMNPMWFIQHKEEEQLKTCLNFDSRIFMFDKDRRASLRKHGAKKRKLKNVEFYPVAKYFVYASDTEAWYRAGIQFDFQAYTPKYVPDDLCFSTFLKKLGKSNVFDDEIKARDYSFKHQRKLKLESNKAIKKNFEARLKKIYDTISTTNRCLELIEELTREFKVLLESGNNKKITTERFILDDDYFKDSFLSYLKMSFISKAIEKTSILKLFAHKYVYLEPEKASESLLELLGVLTNSDEFVDYTVPDGHVIAFRKLSILFLRNKFFAKQDTRKARQLYQEESSLSKESFDVNYRHYSYVDIMTQEVLEAEMYELLYPKTELSEDWTSIDVESFLMNPRKAWTFEKTRWALNVVKLLNSGMITALMNNNVGLRQDLMEVKISEAIAEQVSFVQGCVTNYVHKEEKRSSTRLRRQQSSTESIMFHNRKSIKSGFPSEYFFEFDNELNMEDLLPRYHSMLDPSSKSLVIEQTRGLEHKVDGFQDHNHEFASYIDANAYSLFLNPVVRAELHYSRRRNCCYSDCTGHKGKLVLTLIRLGELESLEFVLANGVKSNMRVCEGETKDIVWVDTVYYSSLREVLKEKGFSGSKVSDVVSRSQRWQQKYKGVLAFGTSFFKSKHDMSIEDKMNLQNDEAIHLKTRYSKVTPLGVALTCYGYDLKYQRDTLLMQQIISCLLKAGAQVTYNGNFAIRSLLPYVEATVAKQKTKHRLVRRQTREQNVDSQRRLTEQTTHRKSSLLSKIMFSIGIKTSKDFRHSKFSSAESLEDITRHEVLTYRTNVGKSDDEEQFIARVLNRSKHESSCLPNVERETLHFDLKWTIMVRIELLYQCLIEEKYDLFRLLAPYSSTFEGKSHKATVRPKSAISEVDDVDPVTAECLFYLLQHLTIRMASTASTLFPKHLQGFCFVLQEYNLVPTKKQLTSVMASISHHLRTNRACLPQTERTILDLLCTGQAGYALFFEGVEFYNERQITSFALYPDSRRKQQLTQSRSWKREAKRIRRKMMKIALKAQLFDTFQFLFDKEGLRHFSPDQLTATFIDSLLVSKDSTNLSEMLRLMENRYGLSPMLIAEPLLANCISNNYGIHLVGVLVDLDIYPPDDDCRDFILSAVKRNPFLSADGKHIKFDRTADLTKIKVFYKFLNHLFASNKDTDAKDIVRTMFLHKLWITELHKFVASSKTLEEKEFIWYEGIQSIVGHLENLSYKIKRTNKYYERYKAENDAIVQLRNSIAAQIEGQVHQDMFYLEDEQKVVLKSNDHEEGKRNSSKIGSSMMNSISEQELGSFLGDRAGSNLMMFAEALAVTGF